MADDSSAPILYEKRDDRIAVITINRPEARNALSRGMYQTLEETWVDFVEDDSLSVAVITGTGDRAFCAGADLKEMAQASPMVGSFKRGIARLLDDWEIDVWKPVIAAVNGLALGQGLSLVMATDMRIAAEDAVFGMSQIKWGIASGTATQILPRFLPYPIGMEMLLTGNNITAQRAYEVGLINKVVPRERLMDEALELARTVAANAPLALQAAKEAAVMGLHMNLHDSLKYGFKTERLNGYTEDAQEGPRAFAEKRPPQWKAR